MTSDLTPPKPVSACAHAPGTDVEQRVHAPWRVLLVGDDADVHRATVFAIGDQTFSGRSVEFLHAYSAAEARPLLLRESNLALVLLDVAMESDQAGLALVDFIRKDAGLIHTRIVLRTAQPGYTPELDTILRYDINDYQSQHGLTRTKLLTLFATTLRSYQQLCTIEANKQSLALIGVVCANLDACLHNQSLIDQLRAQAYSDELLHLPNRARLIADIEERLAHSTPDLAVCLIDVDDFSSVNELMGHRYGDQLLKALAQRIQQVVGPDVMLARVSGNAFGLLGNKQHISPDIVRSCTVQPLRIEDRPHRITVTSGYVELGDPLRAGDDYLKNATIALKQAKKQARGQHVIYTSDIGTEARNRAQLLADLHSAFDHQHLFLMYQPQIDLASGAFIGLEALMRWRRADGTLVPPDRFIPVAEQSGLIVPMGIWALQTACHVMHELIRQDLAPLRMAVNVSLAQFKSPDFFESVVAALAASKLPSNRLELEITESVAMLGSAHVTQQLSRLRAEQIAVSIDDFGTGYSSLSYLEQLPLDRMKIDKAFVRQLGESGSARIAEIVAELGETLGLRVLAEGIEDRASWDALQAMGCHEGQGFFIARPMEMAQLLPWIAAYRTPLQAQPLGHA